MKIDDFLLKVDLNDANTTDHPIKLKDPNYGCVIKVNSCVMASHFIKKVYFLIILLTNVYLVFSVQFSC